MKESTIQERVVDSGLRSLNSGAVPHNRKYAFWEFINIQVLAESTGKECASP